MDKKYLVCLICCEEFKEGCGGGDLGRKEENVESLKQFCEVILEVDKNELEGNGGGLTFLHRDQEEDKESNPINILENKFNKFLKNEDDNLSICRDCLDLIKVVTEARLSAKCVEESVEKLQMLLLRELRRLQGRMELFWGEFKKMEETLSNGNFELIENKLDRSYYENREERKKMKRLSGKISEEHVGRKKVIFGFRQRISEVFRDFHRFRSELVDKIACNPMDRIIETAVLSKKMVDAQVQVEILKQSKKITADKKPYRLIKATSSPPPLPTFDETVHQGYDDDNRAGDMEDGPMHLDNFDNDNDDNFSEDNQVDIKPNVKRASLRRRDKKKDNQPPVIDSDEEDNLEYFGEGKDDGEDEEFKLEVCKSRNKVESKRVTKRLLRRSRKKSKKNNDKDKPPEDKEDEDKWSEDNDDGDVEYNPDEESVNETISNRAQIKKLLREYESHLVKMSPFKRNLVKSVIKCQFLNESHQKRKGPENINVYQRHMVHLSYNLETQLINLKDIPIKIVCQSEEGDGGENGLVCMKCDFKITECPKIGNLMWEHVLSKHLNAYQCPHCEKKQLRTYDRYRIHVWNCQRVGISKVTCEICGKALCNQRALQNHKWRVHWTEEERNEALNKGLVKAHSVKSKKGAEKKFQCEICGKGFAFPRILVEHEKVHKERDSREQIICPKCGKSFLNAGYVYHLKYSVSCGEDNPNVKKETCGICGKGFSTMYALRRHEREMHKEGDPRPWICEICGKGFRKKMTLKMHEMTHTGERPWRCGGCGQAFSRHNNMKRHEKSCGK